MDNTIYPMITQKKFNNINGSNNYPLQKIKIKKIKLSRPKKTRKIDENLKQTLLDNTIAYLDEANKIHYNFQGKNNSRLTPFQIYEKIKLFNLNKLRNKNFMEKIELEMSPNRRVVSLSTNTINYSTMNANNNNKFLLFNYNSLLNEKILMMKMKNNQLKNYGRKKSLERYQQNKQNNSVKISNISKLLVNNCSVYSFLNNENEGLISGRNKKMDKIKIVLKNQKSKDNSSKGFSFVSKDYTAYSSESERNFKILPKINRSIINK